MILDIQALHFGYNDSLLLNSIDLQIQQGELFTILGPNGAGKTTLLKCINGLLKPSSGVVLVENFPISTMKPFEIARRIGYVAQRGESCRLTVFDAVLMGRKPHLRFRVSRSDMKIVDAVLDHLGLSSFTLRFLDELSGGEMQKVAIARALVQEPKLLLFDEPTSALDLKNQVNILSIIRHIVDQHHIGAIMTMHDLNSALRYADRYLMLKDGLIHSQGSPDTLSAQIIEEVYGLAVTIHHVNNVPVIIPLSHQT